MKQQYSSAINYKEDLRFIFYAVVNYKFTYKHKNQLLNEDTPRICTKQFLGVFTIFSNVPLTLFALA